MTAYRCAPRGTRTGTLTLYTSPELGKNQERLAYVLCKDDIQRALLILEKVIVEYNNKYK